MFTEAVATRHSRLEESVACAISLVLQSEQEFAHHERTAAELYGSDSVVDGIDYDQNLYVEPVGAGLRDFFSDGQGQNTVK